jgi:hypothetical protein
VALELQVLEDKARAALDRAIDHNATLAEQALLVVVVEASKNVDNAIAASLDEATASNLGHQNKLKRALNKFLPLLTKYLKKGNKRPKGPLQYRLRAAIQSVGGKFLLQHGGSELTTDNGMDVIEKFEEVAAQVVSWLPEDTEEGKRLREAFKKFIKVAKKLSTMLSYLKSQSKCDEKKFLEYLDELIAAWDEAFQNKYFLKLHHLIQHVYDIIKMYGMYGILSEESMEALHKRINDLMALCKSQSAEKRIAATNAKAQTICKPECAAALKVITEESTGKKRGKGSYNINRSSLTTVPTEASNELETVVVNGEEFAVIMNGQGHLPIKWLELYILVSTGRVPQAWRLDTQMTAHCDQ